MDSAIRERVNFFLEKATCNQLKEKLCVLKLLTTGTKQTLLLRLQDAWENLAPDDLEQHVPPLVNDNDLSSSEMEENETLNDGNDLDRQIDHLRQQLFKKQQIAKLKKQLADLDACEESTKSNVPIFHFRDVEESIHHFSGDDNFSVEKWLNHFEECADVMEWDSKMRLVYGKRLLSGTAKLFLRTVSIKNWRELKVALLEEFSNKVTLADVYNQLRSRKKRSEESFQQYIFIMKEIASLVEVEEGDLIQYIIDGIPDSQANKMILYGANDLRKLKFFLKKYEKMKVQMPSFTKTSLQTLRPSEDQKPALPNKIVRCYNCNTNGHYSIRCPNLKQPEGPCSKCENH